jgi:sulfoxide reductase heme-binding subunit YedZ
LSTTWLWYASRGAGVVSLVLLTAVVVLGILTVARFEAAGWPQFVTQGLHRNLALTSVAFVGLHVVTAVVDPYTNLGWVAAVVPFASYYKTFWLGLGTVSLELVAAIVITSLLRRWLGLRTWRLVHWLAYAAWPTAFLHTFGTGTDAWSVWLLPINAVCVAAVLTAIAYRVGIPHPDPLVTVRSSFRAASLGEGQK